MPCYNTVENWVKKLGLSVYKDDKDACGKKRKFAEVIDESIFINKEKLLLLLGIPADHQGRPLKHEDVTVLRMEAGSQFTGEDVCRMIEQTSMEVGQSPEYIISDQGHNLSSGIKKAGIPHHTDISHSMGNALKHCYGKESDFNEFTALLGKVRLQYHLTDKAFLLPPNMRAICRFMNASEWVDWAYRMLAVFDTLSDNLREAYRFLLDYKELIDELHISVDAIRHIEDVCKNEGLCFRTYNLCKDHIIRHVIGNARPRRAKLGIEMLDYLDKQKALLTDCTRNDNISSDIIESGFGVFKLKKSPNKLFGITPFVLFIPLYSKIKNDNASNTFNFKERLVNVKLKDIDAYAVEHLSKNWVTERTKILRQTG